MKRYFTSFFGLVLMLLSQIVVAQSVSQLTEEEVTQSIDLSQTGQAVILNMQGQADNPDHAAFYNSPEFELLFRFKYNKAIVDSWQGKWTAKVEFELIRICGTYPSNAILQEGDYSISNATTSCGAFPSIGINKETNDVLETITLVLNQDHLDDATGNTLSQLFLDYEVVRKVALNDEAENELVAFDRADLINTTGETFVTAIRVKSIIITRGDEQTPVEPSEFQGNSENNENDPVFTLEVTPKPKEVYGAVGNFVEGTLIECVGNLCYRPTQEDLVWKKIQNAHFYDVEWVFIDQYDSETITSATEAFARRRGVRVRTSDRHYLVRLGTELTYPTGRVFFRVRGIGKQKTEANEDIFVTGKWEYSSTFLHIGEPYKVSNEPIIEPNGVYVNAHEAEKNWQYATVFAEEGKYKKVMSYFDPSLRSTQTLTNFTTDASNNGEDIVLVEEQFYDYEGRAVVQTIPAPLHTSSLTHKSVNQGRINFFTNGKSSYDNLNQAITPALASGSLTASYYSDSPVEIVDFSGVDRFKHQNYVPVADGYPYTQVRYTNDGTGRVAAQSGVGAAFKMGSGKEVRTYYLNPSEDELQRLFGDQVGNIARYKKVVTVDPNGQVSVAYIDQAGQTIATALMGNSPEQLRNLESNENKPTVLHLIKNNKKDRETSRTEYTFYNPKPINDPSNHYKLDYDMKGGKTGFNLNGDDICLACQYELLLTVVDAQGNVVQPTSGMSLPYTQLIGGSDLEPDCEDHDIADGHNLNPISFEFNGLPQGQYTVIKELRIVEGYASLINETLNNNPYTEDFRTRSTNDAAIKADEDCIYCGEIVEEDGTVTALAPEDCAEDAPAVTSYTPQEMHELIVSEQLADQSQSNQDQYTSQPCVDNDNNYETLPLCDPIIIDETLTDDEKRLAYSEIPVCILCLESLELESENAEENSVVDQDDTDNYRYVTLTPEVIAIKNALRNSDLYDMYMQRHTSIDGVTTSYYINREGNSIENINFLDPINNDPFWDLWDAEKENIQGYETRSVSPNLILQWGSISYNAMLTADKYIKYYNGNGEADGDPDNVRDDLTIEQQNEVKWIIFSGLYQSFKRQYQKVFYSKHAGFACNPRAIEILFPELGEKESTVNLANLNADNLPYSNPDLFTDYDQQYELFWQGYTGTANCTDWAENTTQLLGTYQGKYCTDAAWQLEETLHATIKGYFEQYCSLPYEYNEHLSNAFKKLYYSPFINYPLINDFYNRNSEVGYHPSIVTPSSADYYVQRFKNFLDNNPTIAEDAELAFRVHLGGASTEPTALFGRTNWNTDFPTEEEAERVLAYIEAAIRTATSINYQANEDIPSRYYTDWNGDGIFNEFDEYSAASNKLLDQIRREFFVNLPSDQVEQCRKEAFYAMLSIPDCKSYEVTEVEVPVSDPSQATVYKFDNSFVPSSPESQHSSVILAPANASTLFDPEDPSTSYVLEATIIPDFPETPINGTKFVVFSRTIPDETLSENDLNTGFEVGFVYRDDIPNSVAGYYIYQTLYVAVRRDCGKGWPLYNGWQQELRETTVLSNNPVDVSTKCHHFLLTDALKPQNPSSLYSQDVFYDGIRINRNNFDNVQDAPCFLDQGNGGAIEEYYTDIFPLGIGTVIRKQNSGHYPTIDFNGAIREVKLWKKTTSFDEYDILPYREKKFSSQLINLFANNLLGYWKLNRTSSPYTFSWGEMYLFMDETSNSNHIIYKNVYNTYLPLAQQTITECLKGAPPTVKKNVRTCEDTYTFGNGSDLWGVRPLTPLTADEVKEACENVTKQLLADYTERLIIQQRDVLEAKVKEQYYNECFNTPFEETLNLSYEQNEYHYTLYYYDQAGNLVQTVPPAGVKTDGTGKHHLKTRYRYNTLGQVVWQSTPDAGKSQFWIDYYGRVKLSQNAEQAKHNEYAYSKFDELGRPYEVGKLAVNASLQGEVVINELVFDSEFPKAGSQGVLKINTTTETEEIVSKSFTLSELTLTFYDEAEVTRPNGGFIVNPNEQHYLKNRVAAVVVAEEKLTTDKSIFELEDIGAVTRYSYDIHGNVEVLWQHLPEETALPEKKVEYAYDLLSGKVNEVIYQRGATDEFRHRYGYDGDNRLTKVETSLDGYHWTLEASYFYYAHGSLARIEVGEHNVQGTDYFYTLQGWIKGVNAIGLDEQNDLGKDGLMNQDYTSTFNSDEFAYALNYYQGDYTARGGNPQLGKAFQDNEVYTNFTGFTDELDGSYNYKRESLYNGNIAAMATSIRKVAELPTTNPSGITTQSMNYRYDQLHRIAAAEARTWKNNTWANNGGYRTSYKYDANGNILKLNRRNQAGSLIDELEYKYLHQYTDNDQHPVPENRARIDMQNRLREVFDLSNHNEGLNDDQKYTYDEIGNLTQNVEDDIQKIVWNIYGKVVSVERLVPSPTGGTQKNTISYRYDGTGNRISKQVIKEGQNPNGTPYKTTHTNSYLRDASGNVLALYEGKANGLHAAPETIVLKETIIYGSSRVGQYRGFKNDAAQGEFNKKTALGQRIYEFSNHLGNVLVTLTDHKLPQTEGGYTSFVLSASDYYPFGLAMTERTYQNGEYRFGFQGQEHDEDFGSSIQDYGFRLYAPSIAKFLSVDPLTKGYPMLTPYQFASNSPITNIDLDGLEAKDSKTSEEVIGTIPQPSTAPEVLVKTEANVNYTHGQVLINPNGDGKDYQVTKVTPKLEYFFIEKSGTKTVLTSPYVRRGKPSYFDRVDTSDLNERDVTAIRRNFEVKGRFIRALYVNVRVKEVEVELTELQPVMEEVEITTYRTGEFGVLFRPNSTISMPINPSYMATLGEMKSDTQEVVTITGNYDSSNGETQNLAIQRATITENLFKAANKDIKTQTQTQDSSKSKATIEIITENKRIKTRKTGSYWNLQKNNSSNGN